MKLGVLVAALAHELVFGMQLAESATAGRAASMNELRRLQQRREFKGLRLARFEVELPFVLAEAGVLQRHRLERRARKRSGFLGRAIAALGGSLRRLGSRMERFAAPEIAPGVPDVELLLAREAPAGRPAARWRLVFAGGNWRARAPRLVEAEELGSPG